MSVLDHVQLHFVRTLDDALELKRWLGERRRFLGVDTETGGFDHVRDELRLVQFGDLNHGWAVPYGDWAGFVKEVLETYDEAMVLHNSQFDARFIHTATKQRWKWENTHDTMTMAHLLDPLRPKGLKPLAAAHVDAKAVSAQQMLDDAMATNKWSWATVPVDFPYYWVYGAMDPVLTCYMAEKFYPQIVSQYSQVYDLEMNTLRVVYDMMIRGARVDLHYCEAKSTELMNWAHQAMQWTAEYFGVSSSMSSVQLGKAFKKVGVELPPVYTKSGAQSFDKEALEMIDHPLAETILRVRKVEKFVGPYLRNFIKMADTNDRVHPTIWALGTRTGRMSITDPALQTLPRKDPTVRDAFIPSERRTLISCDYDQIEARLAAHFAQDANMIAAFSGEDFFYALASQIYGKPPSEIAKEERQLTKNTTYGKLYGAGPAKMALTAKVPLDVMQGVVDGFDREFPGIKVLQRRINDTAAERALTDGVAWIRTPMGRRLVADDSKEYTLTNYLIQSHAAEILKRSLIEMDAAGLGEYMILPVHDEVIFDVPHTEVADVLPVIGDVMSDKENYLVPITASPEVIDGPWGSKYR